jgi:hypothetical protein
LSSAALKRIVLEPLILFQPPARLYNLERIRRRHQHLGHQCVRIKRDRREQRIDLSGLEQLSCAGALAGAGAGWVCAFATGKGNKQNKC